MGHAVEQQLGAKALVIGSGFGGLAAAIRLGARGYRVKIIERRDQPGGRAYVYRQDGFTFDGGPTVITAPQLFDELWALCGRRFQDDVTLKPVDPFYAVRFDDGTTFRYNGDPDAMIAQIQAMSPRDVVGYQRFMRMSEQIFNTGFTKLAHRSFDRLGRMLSILPEMVRLKSYRTVYGLVSQYVQDPRLRQVFSFHPLLVGGNPFTTTSIYTLICFLERQWGVHFPIGGTGALIDGMLKLIDGQGGEIAYNQTVEQILVEQGRAVGVRLDDGQELRADIVVSNADSAWTYRHLVPSQFRRRWTDRRIEKSQYSMGLFVWYFGTNRQYHDVDHHTILLGPRYKELLTDIFDRKVLADDFSLYLHRPTATDPNLAPPGCDGFYVLSPVPHLDGSIDWEQQQEVYRRRIAQFLEQTILPGLSAHLVTSHVITPLHFRDTLLSYKGAAFSFQPIFQQSAWFRPHNRSEDIEGLYCVGAGTHPGAGVPGVLTSAKVLDEVVPHGLTLVSAEKKV